MRLGPQEARPAHTGIVRECILCFQWGKIMEVFGKENCILKLVTLAAYLIKTASGDSRLWEESNRMQVFPILPSPVLSSFFESGPASSFHSEKSAAFLHKLFVAFWFFIFGVCSCFCFSQLRNICAHMDVLLSKILALWHKRFSVENWLPSHCCPPAPCKWDILLQSCPI